MLMPNKDKLKIVIASMTRKKVHTNKILNLTQENNKLCIDNQYDVASNDMLIKALEDDYSNNNGNYQHYNHFFEGFYKNCLLTNKDEIILKRKQNFDNIKNFINNNIFLCKQQKIPKITHRIWLTSSIKPYEIEIEKLDKYINFISKFDNEFTHYFWCIDKNSIPTTINYLKKYDIKICELNLIYASGIFNRYMYENRYTAASDVARFNILYEYGGIYSDFGASIVYDKNLLKFDYVFGQEGYCLGTTIFGAKKNSKILYKICKFMENMDRISENIKNISDNILTPPWTSIGILTCIADYFLDADNELLLPISYNKTYFYVNHMGSWLNSDINKRFGQPNFQKNPILLTTYFIEKYKPCYDFNVKKDWFLNYNIYFYNYEHKMDENSDIYIYEHLKQIRKQITHTSLNTFHKNHFILNDSITIINHRCWLTNRTEPKNMSVDNILKLKKSIQFLNKGLNKNNKIWLWHNYDVIPKLLTQLDTGIELKHINTILNDNFRGKYLFVKLMNDKRFANANDILRMNLVYKYGGLYTDMGVEFIGDISNLLADYDYAFYSYDNNNIDHGILFAKTTNAELINMYLENIDNKNYFKYKNEYFKTPEHELVFTGSHFLMHIIDTHFASSKIFLFKNNEYINIIRGNSWQNIDKSKISYFNEKIIRSNKTYLPYYQPLLNSFDIDWIRYNDFNFILLFFSKILMLNYSNKFTNYIYDAKDVIKYNLFTDTIKILSAFQYKPNIIELSANSIKTGYIMIHKEKAFEFENIKLSIDCIEQDIQEYNLIITDSPFIAIIVLLCKIPAVCVNEYYFSTCEQYSVPYSNILNINADTTKFYLNVEKNKLLALNEINKLIKI